MSNFLKHIPCEHCGSSDANSLYDDGHQHCFKCGTTVFAEEGEYDRYTTMRDAVAPRQMELKGTIKSIPDRGINQQTCEKFGVTQDESKHYYPYTDASGARIAAKVRTVADKSFTITGNFKDATLFGQSLFHSGGKYVTVYEGELDALAGYQLTGFSPS